MKISAQDLRIGIWINYVGSGDVQITSKEAFLNVFNDLEMPYPKSRPIPLTEEWLKKFGFHEKYKSTSNRWLKWSDKINAGLELHDCEDENGKLQGIFYHNFVLEVLYVHQLQNLYFALTGYELELTEN